MATDNLPSSFGAISTLADLAQLLGSSEEQLGLLLYGRPEARRYTSFTIKKRSGGARVISAPREDLKSIQRRLAFILQAMVVIRPAVHGFVNGKSIASNADKHTRQRIVFNVDLKDFFPSINYGRVRGLFMAQPFSANAKIATILAQICCHNNSLPQGAPTSPIVSNLICYRMDAALTRLASRYNCFYTRYADDMTFSRRKGILPPEIASESNDGEFVIGSELKAIIDANGFQPHPDKVRLYRNTHRQSVTGLTVNAQVNVPREFVRNVRAMICDWRRSGHDVAEARHHREFYRHPSKRNASPPLRQIIAGKLSFLQMIRGVSDPVRRNLQRQLVGVWPEYLEVMERENMMLDSRDIFVSHASEDKGFVRPLVTALIKNGISVWYDEYELTIGDDLVARIAGGLANSRYGIVVLSPNFFERKKTWPDREVGAMFAMEDADERPRVLPIWHNVDHQTVARKNPLLAGKFAWKSTEFTAEQLAEKFRDFLKNRR